MGVSAYVLPYYSKQIHILPELEVSRNIKRFFNSVLGVVLAYCIIMCYFSFDILLILYPQYAVYHEIVYILSIGIGFNIMFKPFDVIFRINGKQKYILYARSAAGILALMTGILLIKNHGLQGAAFTYAISQASMFICLYIMAKGYVPFKRVPQGCTTTVD
jgi:O-antigen/teichoic acid export membrane protein